MERAEELRPGSRVAARTRQRWLCEVDGMLREKFFRPSSADSREGVGADIAWDNGLRDDDVLLVPPPFDSLYPHYLCAMTDAALAVGDLLTAKYGMAWMEDPTGYRKEVL